MDIKSYKKLQKEIDNQSYSEAYKPLNKILKVLSFIGNIGSIFLASFFIFKLIKDSVQYIDSDVIIWLITLTLLCSLELIKRFIFDRFSLEFVKHKNVFIKSVAPLAISSLLIISMSFYSSLTGAKEFSSKSDVITNTVESNVSSYGDSIRLIYNKKIEELNIEIKYNKDLIKSKNIEETSINDRLIAEAKELWASQKNDMRKRVSLLKDEKVNLKKEIDDNEAKIVELNSVIVSKINKYNDKLISKSDVLIAENKDNSFIFIILSTIIEFLILAGIYYSKYYNNRSYNDMKHKMLNDPNYYNWNIYIQILSLCVKSAIGDAMKLPSTNELWNLCKIQEMPISRKELDNAITVFKSLKIIKSNGSNRFMLLDINTGESVLSEHFGI